MWLEGVDVFFRLFGVSHYLRINARLFLIFAQSFITNDTVNEGEKRIVLTDAYVRTGINLRTSLADEDVACENELTIRSLATKAFRLAVSTVVGRPSTFLMSE